MAGVVVIGGGQAAGQLVATLRQGGFVDPVAIVGDEPYLPYQRPPLSKQFLSGEWNEDKLMLRPQSFYQQKNIEIHHTAATGINAVTQQVQLKNGDVLAYDRLILATGSRVRKLTLPGSDLDNLFYLRTLADVVGIKASLKNARRLVIVGGGYIGLEVAAIARKQGKDVDVLEMESRILQRVTTPYMSAFYAKVHSDQGVRIHVGRRVSGFVGEQTVAAVRCEDGQEFPADIVVIGVGVIPNVELAQNIGAAVENGILVNERCETSLPNVYAIGDCARGMNLALRRAIRLESVPNAMEQARVTAMNICGRPAVYDSMPWFWSDQYDLKLQMVGFASDSDTEVRRGDVAGKSFTTIYLKEGIVCAADSINTPRDFLICRQMAEKRTRLDLNRFADPQIDLKELI